MKKSAIAMELGSRGGKAIAKIRGKEGMTELGKAGARARWKDKKASEK